MSALDPENKVGTDDLQAEPKTDPLPDDNSQNVPDRPKEIGGRGGLDLTRYGDWEKAGRCIDF